MKFDLWNICDYLAGTDNLGATHAFMLAALALENLGDDYWVKSPDFLYAQNLLCEAEK